MRRLAKASSAGSTSGQGSSLGSRIRGAFAGRGGSSGGNGSGAPSHRVRARLAVTLLAMAVLAFAIVSSASATKYYDSYFGNSSASATGTPASPAGTAYGNTFGTGNGGVGDIVVNSSTITTDGSGQSGWIYVVDRGNNRITAFNANKEFQWTIGRDVVAPNVNEAQLLTVNATAGKFKLEFNGQTTGDLEWNSSTSAMQTALRGLSTITGTNVNVTGTPATATTPGTYVIAFVGTLAAANQNPIVVQPGSSALTGTAAISTAADGSATPGAGDTNEKQTITVGGGAGGGSYTVSFGATAPTSATINFGATVGDVKSALETIGGIGTNNVNVTGSTGGPYTVEFIGARASVDQAQMTANGSGLTPSGTVTVATMQDGASFEKCTVASQCKVGTTATTAATALGNAGTFNIATGIDIDQATGNLFVRERSANSRVQEFSATGTFIRAFGWDVTASGPGNTGNFETCNAAAGDVCQAGVAATNFGVGNPGQFGSSSQNANGLAVAPPSAPNAGQVYVADPVSARIQRFTIPVSPIAAVGAGVPFGKTSGEVIPRADDQLSRSNDGTWPRDLAADANGIVYAAVSDFGSLVKRYDTTTNSFLTQIDLKEVAPPVTGLGSIEIDPTTNRLLAFQSTASGIKELDTSDNPSVVEEGDVVDSHVAGLGATPAGLGISNGRYFISTSSTVTGTGSGQRVLMLDDNGVDPSPTITLFPPSNVGGTTAIVNATINPNGPTGLPTFYRFQISKNGIDWIDATQNALVGTTGDGGSPVSVSGEATGLDGNTFYRVRVVTSRSPVAGTALSTELTFLTDRIKPEVTTLYPQGKGTTTATLTGTIRPHALATNYYFEWGKTTQYERGRAPIPDGEIGGALPIRTVAQNISGLFPASIFHYRLVAKNAEGTTFGNDIAFETRPTSIDPASRSYEMVTPPFKATRAVVTPGPVGHNSNTGVPSLDGEAVAWQTFVFPLTEDVRAPFEGDKRIIRRTADGWSNRTLNTLPLPPQYSSLFTVSNGEASSGDLRSFAWGGSAGEGELIPSIHSNPGHFSMLYTVREGTGEAGYTQWVSNADSEVDPFGVVGAGTATSADTRSLFNDDGSAMVRWGGPRGLARLEPDPVHPGRMVTNVGIPDPSLTQQLFGLAGGNVPYIVRAADPNALPTTHRDLVSGCTGMGGNATQIPMRNPNGTTAVTQEGDDYIDTQACVQPTLAVEATGTGNLTNGSIDVTGVSTTTGAFSPGQVITGKGVPFGTTIAAVGAGTLTLSAPAAPKAAATGNLLSGSNVITNVALGSGAFAAGQTITGAGIPAGTTIIGLNAVSLTLSQNATATGTGITVASDPPDSGAALMAAPRQVTSFRGAVVGGVPTTQAAGVRPGVSLAQTAMSNDGNRVFFESPDPNGQSSSTPVTCATFSITTLLPNTGPLTDCPTQLYVRQYGTSGNAFVRWISQSQDFGAGPPAAGTGTLAAGSNVVTGLTTTTGTFTIGRTIRGNGIPAGTTITSTGANTLTLSQNATASGLLTPLSSGSQQMGQLTGPTFQGASRDGRYVYFLTASPLLPSDPNNGTSSTTGSAASTSSDLYRYTLPSSRDADPATGSLTRISAGPAPDAIGSGTIASGSPTVSGVTTSNGAFAVNQKISANGIPAGTTIIAVGAGTLTLSANASASGSRALSASSDPNVVEQSLRFLSDDGERAYFLTSAPISGADKTPPKGGITTPIGLASQTDTRDLYVFDGTATGAERYKFIAALPMNTGAKNPAANGLNACATKGVSIGVNFGYSRSSGGFQPSNNANCFRGTASGNAVTFFTAAKLTSDDDENTGDIYLYDIRTDELTRITAQPGDVAQQSYSCASSNSVTFAQCYGDMSQSTGGMKVTGGGDTGRGWGGFRYTNITEDAHGIISVYFETPLQFVPEDTNSSNAICSDSQLGIGCWFWDVYQWRNGEFSLISPGNSDDNSWFSGNSVDGSDVFFLTSARIDPREIDDSDFDIYDARVGGGFPYTPPPAPCDVLAHECRGAISTQAAPDANVASSSVGASDNALSTPNKKAKKKKAKKKAKKKQRKSKRSSRNRSGK